MKKLLIICTVLFLLLTTTSTLNSYEEIPTFDDYIW